MTVRSSGPSATDASVFVLSAAVEVTAAEEAKVEDAGTTMAPARSGVISLMRSAGRASVARAPGGTSLVWTIVRATLASLR